MENYYTFIDLTSIFFSIYFRSIKSNLVICIFFFFHLRMCNISDRFIAIHNSHHLINTYTVPSKRKNKKYICAYIFASYNLKSSLFATSNTCNIIQSCISLNSKSENLTFVYLFIYFFFVALLQARCYV